MPGQATTVGSKIMLDAVSGRATQTARTMYVALLTAAPTDATTMASMAEVTTPATNGYNRVAYGPDDPTTTEESGNTGVLTFGPFSADLANVTHLALVSALTGTVGDLVWYWTADVAKDPAINDTITIAVNALTMAAE